MKRLREIVNRLLMPPVYSLPLGFTTALGPGDLLARDLKFVLPPWLLREQTDDNQIHYLLVPDYITFPVLKAITLTQTGK
jgi:hypothetical protein